MDHLTSDPKTDSVLVVAKDMGALVAYEVICSLPDDYKQKPTTLITTGLSLGAGIRASPTDAIFQWLPSADWARFSNAMPPAVSWYHVKRSWPVCDWSIRTSFDSASEIPSAALKQTWYRLTQGVRSSLVSRIMVLAEECRPADYDLLTGPPSDN